MPTPRHGEGVVVTPRALTAEPADELSGDELSRRFHTNPSVAPQ
jgi:hypothetical protein